MKIIIILSAMLSTMMLMNILIVFVFCIKKRKIFERCKRYKPIPNKNIEIGLDPKIEYFTKVYQFRNNLRLKCGNESEKVIWKKNDEEINVEGHVNKYKTDKHGNLFIFDVKMEDKGRYQCFAPEGHADTYAVNIEIQTLKLNGPMDILQDEDLSRNAEKYVCIIWNGDKDRDVNSIVEITEISRPSMYPGDASGLQGLFPESNKQAELKFLFHCCVLLSKNFTLKWGEINENHLDRINQLLQSTLRLNINDYRESAVKQETLISSEGSITFASEEAKIQTFWTLLQRCHVPKRLIDYVFDNKLANLIIRFLRLDGHKCSDSETCIVLSSLHVEKYLEFLISKYFTGKDESDMEENSVLKKIIIDGK
ncbi:uncharacterized protein LOC134267908 [Saccostrea cucullata]|uniref:uncharacterized protein LOC134267908 n=1 Tax=Saccostrea cuccullata TaxID=36930 RepID=UPI002ED4589D